MKRILALLLVVTLFMTLMPAGMAEEMATESVYKTYFSSEYPSLNYYATIYGGVRGLAANSVEALVEPDQYGVYQPAMAESWTHNEDSSVWTFKLREGVEWVDYQGNKTGRTVTAQDYVDAVRYIGDPKNGAYSIRVVRDLIAGLYDYYWDLDDIDAGVKTDVSREDYVATFDDVVGVKALDDYTVEYTLTMSVPYFLSLIEDSVLLLPVEYDYVMEQGDDFGVDNEHMLYCGAYYISEFQRDKKIVLTKNPHYWDVDSVTLDTIDYQMIPDGTTALEMFKRGEISSCTVEGEEYLSLVGSEWEQYLAPNDFSSSTNYLWLNFKSKNPEFAKFIENENFRKALQYSVDREIIAYLREPVDPSRVVRNTIIAERLIYDDEGVDYTDYPGLKEIKETDYYNPEKAREYMLAAIEELCDENGNILGVEPTTVDMLPADSFEVDGKLPVTVTYVGTSDDEDLLMSQLIKTIIEESIGTDLIEVHLSATTGNFYSTVTDMSNFDVYYDSLSVPYADPGSQLSRLTSDGAENVGYYTVPEYDEMVTKALDTADTKERFAQFAQAEAYLINGAYMIPFISSLRGYYMTRVDSYGAPYVQYGSTKYKGMLVYSEPLSAEYIAQEKANWETERQAALAN